MAMAKCHTADIVKANSKLNHTILITRHLRRLLHAHLNNDVKDNTTVGCDVFRDVLQSNRSLVGKCKHCIEH